MSQNPQRPLLLVDTDPGVDDALAILMAHAHGEVLGLSIAAGNTGLVHTLRNACSLVDLLGASTPVFPGVAAPLVRAPAEDAVHVHGADGFGDVGMPDPATQPRSEPAATALVRLARAHAGAFTLVALAPLTNLALALRLDPDLPSRIARLVIMGGAVNGHGNLKVTPAEFNIGFDPEAAHVVFEAFAEFDLVDWELCMRHAFDDAGFTRWLAGDDARARFYARICSGERRWNAERGRRGTIVADALAMAVAIEPGIVTRTERRFVQVELDGRLTRGMTVVDWEGRLGRPANARLVQEVDQRRFRELVAVALGATT